MQHADSQPAHDSAPVTKERSHKYHFTTIETYKPRFACMQQKYAQIERILNYLGVGGRCEYVLAIKL